MIAQKIIYVKREKKISEKQLAKGIEMSITGLRQAMVNNDFKISTVKKICAYLDVSLKYLLDDNVGVNQTSVVNAPVQFSMPDADLTRYLIEKENNLEKQKQLEGVLNQKNDVISDLKYTIDTLKSSIMLKDQMIEFLSNKLRSLDTNHNIF